MECFVVDKPPVAGSLGSLTNVSNVLIEFLRSSAVFFQHNVHDK